MYYHPQQYTQDYRNFTPATSYVNRNNKQYTITVEGSGHVTVKPDQATIILGVSAINEDVQKAQQENTVLSNQIIRAIQQLGVTEDEIRTTTYSVFPRYDYIEGKSVLRGFEVEHLLEVKVKNLANVGMIYAAAIQNGANRTGPLQFSVINPDAYYQQALTLAINQAKAKAVTLANAIGSSIQPIPIRIIEQSAQQDRPLPYKTLVAGVSTEQSPPIQEGTLSINAYVKVIYTYNH